MTITGPAPPEQGAALSTLYVGHLDPGGTLTTIVAVLEAVRKL